LPLETIRTGYKSGLEALLEEKPTKAIFLGTRNGDPNAVTSLESNDACLT
jgi:FAD synthetase